eukprot:Selendium_serpulae@DN5362_c0_g1_i1.p2
MRFGTTYDFLHVLIRGLLAPVAGTMLLAATITDCLVKQRHSHVTEIRKLLELPNAIMKDSMAAAALVGAIVVVTFATLWLVRCNCDRVLWVEMGIAAAVIIFVNGGLIAWRLVCVAKLDVDAVTFGFIFWNLSIGGTVSVLVAAPSFVRQIYMVIISVIAAVTISTSLPSYTIWILLVLISLWDVAAVLIPSGALRQLIEHTAARGRPLPAYAYDAFPPGTEDTYSGGLLATSAPASPPPATAPEEGEVRQQRPAGAQRHVRKIRDHLKTLRVVRSFDFSSRDVATSGKMTLGLGDFIIYSTLASRASLLSKDCSFAAFVAVLWGMLATILPLPALNFRAVPALPISIFVGLVFTSGSYFCSAPLMSSFASDGVLF